MIIRHAHPDDLPGINAVHEACGRSPWDSRVLDEDPDHCVVVAVVDDTIVGAGKTHHQMDAVAPAPAGYYLGGVSVHPDHRRRGIGHALTRARIDWIWQRSDTVLYFTDDHNVASQRMHAGFGFEEIARAPALLDARADGEYLVLFRAQHPKG
ncbi:ribosomal protein S18 acetylase RimI-like enzyme [Microbacterium terrae]|uniref:Mycothiol acetyltransferase n=1 Tax=Microbacterium terrae TaxID=69369 RepID=A0A0M2HE58_9MICO|nr:GNAT family N-acetyltransferase [Microbacterium terrae]KJL44924.1 Mycothiol acetyltransferase [Microbacterium terrae]MBP1076740.1 ribosomal protein S18 acetylase RimI-like enzyme [Microbacterium terrae]